MYVPAIGMFFWLLSILALIRLISIGRTSRTLSLARIALWSLMLVAAILLLFRPHETIFGGQDSGAYLNFGARLGRQPQLFYKDTLLSQVLPTETRLDFLYYGVDRSYLSKFACGRIRDLDKAINGLWFQPAYPIMMSTVARLGPTNWILYVVPLFTLFTALALLTLAKQLIPHQWAGPLAFSFYIISPIVVWHGRCARPEIIASFFLFSGASLFINAWRSRRWARWYDILLGAICISLAPFFHVTAWMLVIPASLLVTVLILTGRYDFLLHTLISVAFLMVFTYEMFSITDTYNLKQFVIPVLKYKDLVISLLIAGIAFLAVWSLVIGRRKKECINPNEISLLDRHSSGRILAVLLSISYVTCFIISVYTPPSKYNLLLHYAYRTDLRTVLNMISVPIGCLGLVGINVLAAGPGAHRKERVAFLLFAVPATLMIGNMYDFFMTRYMLVAIMPLLAISLAALVALIPVRNHFQQGLVISAALLICLFGLHHRTHLIRTVEYAGFTNYLKSYAEKIKNENGILLFEYSRMAAPYDHFFGVPVLALHNERDNDYSKAEEAWEHIMRNNTNRSAFFITPFKSPVSDRFIFTLMKKAKYMGKRLIEQRWGLPTQVAEWGTELGMYRMKLRDSAITNRININFPYVYRFGAGNMNLRRFANCHDKHLMTEGVSVDVSAPIHVKIPRAFQREDVTDVLFFFLNCSGSSMVPEIQVTANKVNDSGKAVHLVDDWFLYRIDADSIRGIDEMILSAGTPVLLTDMQAVAGNSVIQATNLFNGNLLTEKTIVPFTARWARQDAQLIIPLSSSKKSLLCLFLNAPEELAGLMNIKILADPGPDVFHRKIPTGRWLWLVLPLESSVGKHDVTCVTIHTDKTFNPHRRGYPDDLSLFMGYGSVLEMP